MEVLGYCSCKVVNILNSFSCKVFVFLPVCVTVFQLLILCIVARATMSGDFVSDTEGGLPRFHSPEPQSQSNSLEAPHPHSPESLSPEDPEPCSPGHNSSKIQSNSVQSQPNSPRPGSCNAKHSEPRSDEPNPSTARPSSVEPQFESRPVYRQSISTCMSDELDYEEEPEEEEEPPQIGHSPSQEAIQSEEGEIISGEEGEIVERSSKKKRRRTVSTDTPPKSSRNKATPTTQYKVAKRMGDYLYTCNCYELSLAP